MPPAPLYLRTLWHYTNAVIIIIIIIIIAYYCYQQLTCLHCSKIMILLIFISYGGPNSYPRMLFSFIVCCSACRLWFVDNIWTRSPTKDILWQSSVCFTRNSECTALRRSRGESWVRCLAVLSVILSLCLIVYIVDRQADTLQPACCSSFRMRCCIFVNAFIIVTFVPKGRVWPLGSKDYMVTKSGGLCMRRWCIQQTDWWSEVGLLL